MVTNKSATEQTARLLQYDATNGGVACEVWHEGQKEYRFVEPEHLKESQYWSQFPAHTQTLMEQMIAHNYRTLPESRLPRE